MKNFFLWLSGVDKKILSKCSDGEKTKYVGYGTLVLIPAITGIFSMTYAISTITQNTTVIVFAAIIWFFFILFVDRFIVSTLYKSKHTNIWNYIVSVFLRYLFATFVGITVAHPLVLLVFNKNILEKVYADKRQDESKEISKRDSLRNIASVELNNLYKQRDCFNKLLQAEKNGYRIELECGFASGDKGESTSFALAKKQLDSLQNLITKIENK